MKIGLLECDHVDAEYIPVFGGYPEMFASLLQQSDVAVELVLFDVINGEIPHDIAACDGYIISGSRFGVNDNLPWLAPLENFIRLLDKKKKKLIGICFGHQVIVKALGGRVEKASKGWGVGVSVNTVFRKKSWMQPAKAQFNLLRSHQDQVVSLPESAELLAGNHHCTYYMLQLSDTILTLQGHPEFSKGYSRALMEKRRSLLGGACYDQALISLKMHLDDRLIAQWMVNFIKMNH